MNECFSIAKHAVFEYAYNNDYEISDRLIAHVRDVCDCFEKISMGGMQRFYVTPKENNIIFGADMDSCCFGFIKDDMINVLKESFVISFSGIDTGSVYVQLVIPSPFISR